MPTLGRGYRSQEKADKCCSYYKLQGKSQPSLKLQSHSEKRNSNKLHLNRENATVTQAAL